MTSLNSLNTKTPDSVQLVESNNDLTSALICGIIGGLLGFVLIIIMVVLLFKKKINKIVVSAEPEEVTEEIKTDSV
jgi:hypothetical protein